MMGCGWWGNGFRFLNEGWDEGWQVQVPGAFESFQRWTAGTSQNRITDYNLA
jgi:hypothetical protein